MKLKKGIAAALAAVMVLSLTACGSKKEETTTAATETETTTEAETKASAGTEMPEYVSAFDLGDISEYVELGEYKGIEVAAQDTAVTDDEVEAELQAQVENAAPVYEEITEGTVKDGDVANIDFEGKMNGEVFEGGSGKNFNLTIGSGQFIDGFEAGLVGKTIGDTVVLDLNFPENYSETKTELNGAAVEFTVTINYVQGEEVVQELNDEFVERTTNGQYKTVEEYRVFTRTDLEESKAADAKKAKINEAWEKIQANATFKKDAEELVTYIHDSQMSQLESTLAMYGMDVDTYLTSMGQTKEQFDADLLEYCKENAKTQVLVRAIIEAEKMEMTDADYEKGLETLARESGIALESLKTSYPETMLKDILRQQQVQDLVEGSLVEKAE